MVIVLGLRSEKLELAATWCEGLHLFEELHHGARKMITQQVRGDGDIVEYRVWGGEDLEITCIVSTTAPDGNVLSDYTSLTNIWRTVAL